MKQDNDDLIPNLDSLKDMLVALDKVAEGERRIDETLWQQLLDKVPGLSKIVDDETNVDLKEKILERLQITSDKPLTKTGIMDILIDTWFEQATVKFIVERRMPKDGHDVRIDFYQFAYELAKTMKLDKIQSITSEHRDYKKFFKQRPCLCKRTRSMPSTKRW